MIALRLDLAAHAADRVGRRADEDEPGVGAGLREVGVLGEEAVAGMDGVGAGAARDVDASSRWRGTTPSATGGPMYTASSAARTNGASRSGSA